MNWYALRNAALSLLAILLVAAVAVVIPAGSLIPSRDGPWGRAVGVSGLSGVLQGAAVRGSPSGAVLVFFSSDSLGVNAVGPGGAGAGWFDVRAVAKTRPAGPRARVAPLRRTASIGGPIFSGVASEAVAASTMASIGGPIFGGVASEAVAASTMASIGGPIFGGVAPEPVAAPTVASAVAGRGPGSPFRPPVEPPLRVTRRFDGPPRPWLPGHRGVDLASAPGATVWAAGPGEVVFAGPVAGRSVVSIQHPGGLRTTYEPLTPVVRQGDQVAAGDPIGTLEAGHSGCPAAACLHWGLRRDAEYLDPLLLLGFRVRLLPL